MKKLFFATVMMLLSVTANAQSIVGTWTVDKEFAEALNQAVDNENMTLEMGMSFTDSEVKFLVWSTIGADNMNLKMNIWVPGTYTKNGDQVTCTFDKDKTDFEIADIQSDDAEISAMIKEPATKAMVLAMVKGQAKKEFEPFMGTFADVTDNFKEFTVVSATEYALVVNADNLEVSFAKRQ